MTLAFDAAARRAAQSAVRRLTNAVIVFDGGHAVEGHYRQTPAQSLMVAGDRPTFATLAEQMGAVAVGDEGVLECGAIRRRVAVAEPPQADEVGMVRVTLEQI